MKWNNLVSFKRISVESISPTSFKMKVACKSTQKVCVKYLKSFYVKIPEIWKICRSLDSKTIPDIHIQCKVMIYFLHCCKSVFFSIFHDWKNSTFLLEKISVYYIKEIISSNAKIRFELGSFILGEKNRAKEYFTTYIYIVLYIYIFSLESSTSKWE